MLIALAHGKRQDASQVVMEQLIRVGAGTIGFIKSDSRDIMDMSFDILSLEALFLVPRCVNNPG